MSFNQMKYIRTKNYELEFFIADDISLSSFRDEIISMEHPFFALRAGDTKIRKYQNGHVTIIIKPTADGIATIFDKDIWIYSISKLQKEKNKNKKVSKTICFTPYDFFITTNRNMSGRSYNRLRKTLSRLKGTIIETNILYSDNKQETISFGLIDGWKIIEEKRGKLDVGMIEIILPDWLYRAFQKKKILKIHKDYFKLRKAIDRRIYEIARKHCGNQFEFSISLKKLHLKTGSMSLLKMFRHNIKKLAKKNNLPDYYIKYNINEDKIIFYRRI